MKLLFPLVFILSIPFAYADEENPRMIELNPNAWKTLPMETVIADFQEADGVFSGFICNEIIKRLKANPATALKDLSLVNKVSRKKAFHICMHPESGEGFVVLKPIKPFASQYPELVKEITAATEYK